jgi:hypothetical protein
VNISAQNLTNPMSKHHQTELGLEPEEDAEVMESDGGAPVDDDISMLSCEVGSKASDYPGMLKKGVDSNNEDNEDDNEEDEGRSFTMVACLPPCHREQHNLNPNIVATMVACLPPCHMRATQPQSQYCC